jgi:hypothetical protein
MAENADDNSLVLQMLGMNESDLSVLRVALQQESRSAGAGGFGRKRQDVNLATVDGSANDLLWRKFAERGWLVPTDVPGITEGQPDGVLPGKVYLLVDHGRTPIRDLLAARDAKRSEQQQKVSVLGKFHDDKSQAFIAEMRAAVTAAGGGAFDIAALGSLFLKSIVQAVAKQGKEEEALDDIARMTRAMLAQESQAASTG